ncbi:MAG: hypothetical protein ACM3U1_07170 [Chloroflexota bacterium]
MSKTNSQSRKDARKNIAAAGRWVKSHRWGVFLLIIVASALTVAFISNVMTINRLLLENRALERELMLFKNRNDYLSGEVYQLESADRIIPIAKDRMGLTIIDKAPVYVP